MRVALYWQFVESEAALINSDGCTKVTGYRVSCCLEHDLSYRFAKDPRSAYRLHVDGAIDPWEFADPIERVVADARFRRCLQVRSYFGWYSPFALMRWIGVRAFAGSAWESHRERERQAQEPLGV